MAHLLVRATLRSRSEFTRSQVMFFAGSHGIRLASLEHRISRVRVGLGRLSQRQRSLKVGIALPA